MGESDVGSEAVENVFQTLDLPLRKLPSRSVANPGASVPLEGGYWSLGLQALSATVEKRAW